MPKASNTYDFDGYEGVNLLDPQHPQSAATKAWVESHFASGGSSNGYQQQDYEKTGTYVYVGYKHTDNRWYIYRRTVASNLRQYASGAASYATNWTGRAGLVYA